MACLIALVCAACDPPEDAVSEYRPHESPFTPAPAAAEPVCDDESPPPAHCPDSITPADVYHAQLSVEYFRQYGAVDPDPWVLSAVEAATILDCDRSFGCDRRKFEAAPILGPLLGAVANLKTSFQPRDDGLSSRSCCAEIADCKVARAEGNNRLAAVIFTISSSEDYESLAKVLDPQSWDDLPQSVFTIGYLGDECSDMADESGGEFEDAAGTTWTGVIHEEVEIRCRRDDTCSRFRNALHIAARNDPNARIPDEDSRTKYKMKYELCSGGSFETRLSGRRSFKDGLTADCGYSKVRDLGSGSEVVGAKRLEFAAAICEGDCERRANRWFNVSNSILPTATSIAMCKGARAPAGCRQKHCPTESNMSQADLMAICSH